ncbi:MAG: hypothetical protein ACFCVG_11260 [Kineosporiaceae bacterium]
MSDGYAPDPGRLLRHYRGAANLLAAATALLAVTSLSSDATVVAGLSGDEGRRALAALQELWPEPGPGTGGAPPGTAGPAAEDGGPGGGAAGGGAPPGDEAPGDEAAGGPTVTDPPTDVPAAPIPTGGPPPGPPAPSLSLTSSATAALFDEVGMAPGGALRRCLVLTYTGSSPTADIRHAVEVTGALAPHLHLRIETGTGTSDADCSGFVTEALVASGRADALTAAHAPSASPAGPTPVVRGGPVVVRVTSTLSVDTPDAVMGAAASGTLTWTATVP